MQIQLQEALKRILGIIGALKHLSVGSNYITLAGLGMCWGEDTSRTVTFPITFSSTPQVFTTCIGTIPSTYAIVSGVTSRTTTGMTYIARYLHTAAGHGVAGEPFAWLAIGKVLNTETATE